MLGQNLCRHITCDRCDNSLARSLWFTVARIDRANWTIQTSQVARLGLLENYPPDQKELDVGAAQGNTHGAEHSSMARIHPLRRSYYRSSDLQHRNRSRSWPDSQTMNMLSEQWNEPRREAFIVKIQNFHNYFLIPLNQSESDVIAIILHWIMNIPLSVFIQYLTNNIVAPINSD